MRASPRRANAHGTGTLGPIEEPVRRFLTRYSWPGNIRQLRNAMQRAAVLVDGDTVRISSLPDQILAEVGEETVEVADTVQSDADASNGSSAEAAEDGAPGEGGLGISVGTSIADAERRLIEATLESFEGDKKSTAEVLGVSLRTLYNRLNEYEQDTP